MVDSQHLRHYVFVAIYVKLYSKYQGEQYVLQHNNDVGDKGYDIECDWLLENTCFSLPLHGMTCYITKLDLFVAELTTE